MTFVPISYYSQMYGNSTERESDQSGQTKVRFDGAGGTKWAVSDIMAQAGC
jgi:hypothetical protein